MFLPPVWPARFAQLYISLKFRFKFIFLENEKVLKFSLKNTILFLREKLDILRFPDSRHSDQEKHCRGHARQQSLGYATHSAFRNFNIAFMKIPLKYIRSTAIQFKHDRHLCKHLFLYLAPEFEAHFRVCIFAERVRVTGRRGETLWLIYENISRVQFPGAIYYHHNGWPAQKNISWMHFQEFLIALAIGRPSMCITYNLYRFLTCICKSHNQILLSASKSKNVFRFPSANSTSRIVKTGDRFASRWFMKLVPTLAAHLALALRGRAQVAELQFSHLQPSAREIWSVNNYHADSIVGWAK